MGYIVKRMHGELGKAEYCVGKRGASWDSKDATVWPTKKAAENELGLERNGVTGSRAVSKYKYGWIVQKV